MASPILDPNNSASQLAKLDAIIRAASAARSAALTGELFCSAEGGALVDAMHDLTEIDGLFDLADDVRREAGLERDYSFIPTLHTITVRAVG